MKLKRLEGFDIMVYVVIALVCAIMIYPFLNVIAVSLTSYSEYLKNPMMIFPAKLDLAAFKYVLTNNQVHVSYINTIIVTIAGTVIGIALLILTAYPLSKSHLKGRTFFMNVVVFTMMFNGGLIPTYNLIKSIKLLDTLWALILPSALTAFNLILMKNFFESLPESLEEAAKIDGANDWYILFKIIIPLSKPIIATLVMFLAVAYWNNYFNAIMYIRDRSLWTLQLVLREIVLSDSAQSLEQGNEGAENIVPVTIKYASLLVVMLPILVVYPFVQKYFVHGVMVGAVKG